MLALILVSLTLGICAAVFVSPILLIYYLIMK